MRDHGRTNAWMERGFAAGSEVRNVEWSYCWSHKTVAISSGTNEVLTLIQTLTLLSSDPERYLSFCPNILYVHARNRLTEICVNLLLWGASTFAHVAIDHSHSQQPVPRGFPLFKRCEWLVVNCNVDKQAPLLPCDRYFSHALKFKYRRHF